MKPKIWMLGPDRYQYRVEFHFVDLSGTLLRTKTWELIRETEDPPKVLLLQANAKVASTVPAMKELGVNYVRITVSVSEMTGELVTTTFTNAETKDEVNQKLAAFPVTLGVVLENKGLQFSMHVTSVKP